VGGDLFSPSHPPVRRTILHVGETYATKLSKSGGARRGTRREGSGNLLVRLFRWQFCSGGRWRCCGSRMAAPSSGAAVSSGGERDSCSSLLWLLFLFFLFLFMCVFFNSRSSSCFGIVPLPYLSQSLSFISHSPSPLFPASPFSFFFFFQSFSFSFFSFSSLRSLFFSLSSSCVLALGGIYGQRQQGVPIAALLLRMGSRALLPCHGVGLAGQWAWLAGRGSPGLSSWGCVGLRVWQSTRGGRWAWRIKEEKNKKFLSSPAARPGEEEGGTMLLKTTPFCSFFFNMKRRRFGQNAPFHLNMAPTCQLPNQSLMYLLFISIASLPTSIAALMVSRLFHFHPWSPSYAIWPSIDQ